MNSTYTVMVLYTLGVIEGNISITVQRSLCKESIDGEMWKQKQCIKTTEKKDSRLFEI